MGAPSASGTLVNPYQTMRPAAQKTDIFASVIGHTFLLLGDARTILTACFPLPTKTGRPCLGGDVRVWEFAQVPKHKRYDFHCIDFSRMFYKGRKKSYWNLYH